MYDIVIFGQIRLLFLFFILIFLIIGRNNKQNIEVDIDSDNISGPFSE
jgi:hypothetical protein